MQGLEQSKLIQLLLKKLPVRCMWSEPMLQLLTINRQFVHAKAAEQFVTGCLDKANILVSKSSGAAAQCELRERRKPCRPTYTRSFGYTILMQNQLVQQSEV